MINNVFKYDPCWFSQLENSSLSSFFNVPICVLDSGLIATNLINEIKRLTEKNSVEGEFDFNAKIIFSTFDRLPETIKANFQSEQWQAEGFQIKKLNNQILIVASDEAGLLYGFYQLLNQVQLHGDALETISSPDSQLRMINHWDNMNHDDFMGSVERGYAGKSIFFQNYDVTENLERIEEYARLLASAGINAVSINNVNVHSLESKLITPEYLPKLKKLADIFERFAVKMYLSINFASPITLKALNTSDPLDEDVIHWWQEQAKVIYQHLPNLGGFVVKADSEGRPGPFTYGRNHADGANMLARAIAPFGGTVIWRCFVYNCQQDWRDRKTDRARAAYDHFMALDGLFLDNVVLQIKNGPMDFQVREGVSPLLGAMPNTNCIMELQIAQEYTGQQIDVCYLANQWQTIFNFDTHLKGEGSTIRRFVNGQLNQTKLSGIAAVSNIGDDHNWCGHKLAQANFYSYGRMAWDSSLTPQDIAKEWIALTFGRNEQVNQVIFHILDTSWLTYESYTAPLGVGWMVNPSHHYGPNVDGYEYDRWGTYHFADRDGIGVDRTSQGTGYIQQYHPVNQQKFEQLATCPDELVLFFHHLPYTHQLHSGKTIIQHIYDTHFAGVLAVEDYLKQWETLNGLVQEHDFEQVQCRLTAQLNNAKEWRDIINTYFLRKSGINDKQGRTIY